MENSFRGVTVRLANNIGGITQVEIDKDGGVWFNSAADFNDISRWATWFTPEEVALIGRLSHAVKIQNECW